MDLIERYVQEVSRRLPRKQREDVARELRSSLEDSLENRAGVPLEQVDEAQAVELLLEFGRPQDVAASYRTGPDYLIGPALYPSFIRTMKICLAVVGGLMALGILLDIVGSSGDLRELGWIGLRTISDLQSGFLGLLGLVVLVFATIERASTPGTAAEESWDPHDLPPVAEDKDQVDRTGTIVGLVLGTLALLLINLWPEWLQVTVWSSGDQFSAPLLHPGLRTEIFIFNAYLMLSIALGAVVLVQGRWHLGTRIADALISTVLVLFLSRLWVRAHMFLPDEADLVAAGWPAEQAVRFAEISAEVLSPLLWWVYLAAFLAAAWGSVSRLTAVGRTVFGR